MTKRPMEVVIVERRFGAPMKLDMLDALEREHAWCLEANEVHPLRSYLSHDGLRMICAYLAPDAEAVRRVNDVAQMPYEVIWTGRQRG